MKSAHELVASLEGLLVEARRLVHEHSQVKRTPRQLAMDRGEKTYEGKPCRDLSHVNENGTTTRLVSNRGCRECNRLGLERWKRQREEHLQAYEALYNKTV